MDVWCYCMETFCTTSFCLFKFYLIKKRIELVDGDQSQDEWKNRERKKKQEENDEEEWKSMDLYNLLYVLQYMFDGFFNRVLCTKFFSIWFLLSDCDSKWVSEWVRQRTSKKKIQVIFAGESNKCRFTIREREKKTPLCPFVRSSVYHHHCCQSFCYTFNEHYFMCGQNTKGITI